MVISIHRLLRSRHSMTGFPGAPHAGRRVTHERTRASCIETHRRRGSGTSRYRASSRCSTAPLDDRVPGHDGAFPSRRGCGLRLPGTSTDSGTAQAE